MKLFPLSLLFLLTNALSGQQATIVSYGNGEEKALLFIPFFEKNSWSCFFQATFELPKALDYARTKKVPIIMFIPTSIKGFSPLENGREWVEGARVALTWASIYTRFKELGPIDVRVVRVDDAPSQENIIHATQALLSTPPATTCGENALDDRFFSMEALLKNQKPLPHNDYSTHPLFFDQGKEQKIKAPLLKPLLNEPLTSQKRFLITGAAGFIGSHLTKALLAEGHQVIGVDNLLCGNTENIKELFNNPNFFFCKQDVTHTFDIDGPIDVIIHLASVPSPEFYYRLPLETMTSGLHGTRNMLELAVKKNAQFLFSSTSEVYGDPEKSPQDESYAGNVSPIGKRSQYDQSKRGGETVIKFYFEQYGLDVRIARIFNTYGPNMSLGDGRVVTNFIRALLLHEPMNIYGAGMQTRSFSYISDTVQGLLQLIHVPFAPTTPIQERVVNIGSNQEFTIIELAHLVNDLALQFGITPAPIECIAPIDATDPKQRRPDLNRAKNLLSYEPTVTLESGLEKTMAYFVKKEVETIKN